MLSLYQQQTDGKYPQQGGGHNRHHQVHCFPGAFEPCQSKILKGLYRSYKLFVGTGTLIERLNNLNAFHILQTDSMPYK